MAPRTDESALDRELAEQMARNRQIVTRALTVAAGAAGAVVVLALVLTFFVGIVMLIVVVAVAGAAGYVASVVAKSDEKALQLAKAVPCSADQHARLHNVTEGLSSRTGIPHPALYVVDDPSVNVFAVGLGIDHSPPE